MATYFLDTSAIVKRYADEQGQSLILTLCDPAQGHQLYIAQTALVEVVAGMCRKARAQSITIAHRDILIEKFRKDSQSAYGIRPVTTATYTFAGNLCRLHKLRAFDAVQLACVLHLRNKALAKKAPAPIFVCADIDLINAAIAEELSVENPSNYP